MFQKSGFRKTLIMLLAVLTITTVAATQTNASGITVYREGDKYVKIGGRIQLQYHSEDPDTGSSPGGSTGEQTDELFFRRLRPYIEGSLHKDWSGKFQFDLGGSTGDNEIAIKDAFMEYTGYKNHKVRIGNAYAPFSREALTSSKKQQLVERTFVGDHNYGSPDRNLGVHVLGHNEDKRVTYGVSVGSASIDPDDDKLDFDTPVNKSDDFNEGWMLAARVDFHPLENLKLSQGDFKGETKATIGVAVFTWSNDDDNNTYTDPATGLDTSAGAKPDVDSVTGLEVSAALRGRGASIDAQYNTFDADTVDSTVTSGIYKMGSTTLTNFAVEGGYMVMPEKLELVAGFQAQDADNYATEWERTSVGVNYFIKKHDIKAQLTYRMGENIKGKKDSDEDELFVQLQYVF